VRPIGLDRFVPHTTVERRFMHKRLIPFYMGEYEFKGQKFRYVIHGHTGEMKGEIPHSILKSAESLVRLLLFLVFMVVLMYVMSGSQSGVVYYAF